MSQFRRLKCMEQRTDLIGVSFFYPLKVFKVCFLKKIKENLKDSLDFVSLKRLRDESFMCYIVSNKIFRDIPTAITCKSYLFAD